MRHSVLLDTCPSRYRGPAHPRTGGRQPHLKVVLCSYRQLTIPLSTVSILTARGFITPAAPFPISKFVSASRRMTSTTTPTFLASHRSVIGTVRRTGRPHLVLKSLCAISTTPTHSLFISSGSPSALVRWNWHV